jgi:beta-galactosidase
MPSRFLYGVTYYPEHWPRSFWARDLDRMARAGMNVVRMGEGAWSYWEPREGEFQFELFDEVIDLCAKRDIRVILGTPTYCAPAWVSQQYPEVLRWNYDRIPMAHGSRRNLNYTSSKYFELSDKLCTALASHYAKHKSVISWQLDNEFNCHMDVSYAPSDTIAFRAWLRAKYRTLDALNDAWGTKFWSQTYTDWDQLDLPHPTATYHNPTQLLDESRFVSDCAVRLAERQAKILRKHNPRWQITHNGLFPNMNGPDLARPLDFFSHDHYPLFWADWPGPAAKLVEARSLTFPYAIMEQQAGPGGQMSYLHRTALPGEMALWATQSVAHGADQLLFFTWRTCPFGSEQHWHGLIDQDDRDGRRLREATELGAQFDRLPEDFLDAAPTKDVAVLRDFDNDVNEQRVNTYTGAGRWGAQRWVETLSRSHVPVDVVWANSSLAGYRTVIAGHLKIVDDSLAKKLIAFARSGGTLVLGAQSGLMDRNAHIRQTPAPGPFAAALGATVDEWTTIADKSSKPFWFERGGEVQAIAFAESLRPTAKDVQVLARWQGDPLFGNAPAIVSRKVGKGRIVYVGAYLTRESTDAVRESLDLGTPVVQASDRVESVLRRGKRADYLVLLNHANDPHDVLGLPAKSRVLAGSLAKRDGTTATLAPFGTAVLALPRGRRR